MHAQILMNIAKLIPIKWLLEFGRALIAARSQADIAELRRRGEAAARANPTASVIRNGLVPLRTSRKRRAALALEGGGHGRIFGDIYEAWVDATPRDFTWPRPPAH